MDRRLELHEILCDVLGSRHVYYNPPESIKLEYPCIIYNREANRENHADNMAYFREKSYSVTVISWDPDNDFSDLLEDAIHYCHYDRRFISDDLYHDVLTVFY